MRDKILITGAGGKLGHALIKRIGAEHIYGLDLYTDSLKGILDANHIFTVKDFESKKIPLDEIKVIIHCAFARSQDGAALASSIDFSRDIFIAAVENNIPGVINISSQSIYGIYRDTPSTEDGSIDPMDMYAVAKYACEKLAKEISKNTKTKIASLRLASLIGPEFSERVVYKMVDAAVKTKNIKVVGGKQVFSFLNIVDAADGIAAMLNTKPNKWSEVYNLATDERYTIKEMADQIADVVKGTVVDFTPSETHQSIKTNPNKFLNDFCWHAKLKLRDSIVGIYNTISGVQK